MKYQQRRINVVDAVRFSATPDSRKPEFNENPAPQWVTDAIESEKLIPVKMAWGTSFYVWQFIVDLKEFDTYESLFPGQWLVLHGNGNMSVWEDSDFEDMFMPIYRGIR